MPDPTQLARPVVLILDDYEGLLAKAPATVRLSHDAEVRILDHPLSQVPDDQLRDVDAVVALRERTRFDDALLRRLPKLELVLQTGTGANHIDAAAMSARGVAVALGQATVGLAAVPELTLGLMVAAMRHFPAAERARTGGRWPLLTGRTLRGRRLGVLGMGRLGSRVARLGQALGMDVVAWGRPGAGSGGAAHPARHSDDDIERLPLDAVLASSDVVSIHLKLTPESRGLLDATRLRSMRPGSVLINTARGAIVDEAALVDVLTNGPLAAAGLDVFADEPLPAEHPLRRLPNVVFTPH
uniref:NAD(P)-dependent oxidoreductase n=1 Tax=Haloactinopolyspora sp. TaxID=1966353 RepID=UPI00261A5F7C